MFKQTKQDIILQKLIKQNPRSVQTPDQDLLGRLVYQANGHSEPVTLEIGDNLCYPVGFSKNYLLAKR